MANKIHNARAIGACILLAFPAYGFGRNFFEGELSGLKYFGASLIVINSCLVLFAGIFFRRTLSQYVPWVGTTYLFTRIFEAVVLASLVLTLNPSIQMPADLGYHLAMLVLGLGSIPMCLTLLKHHLAPSWMALWGAVGYGIFALGFLLELLGTPLSWYLLVPAALWEITFGFWLVFVAPRIQTLSHSKS